MNLKWGFLLVAGLAGAAGGWLFTETVLNRDSQQVQASPGEFKGPQDLVGTTRPNFSLGSTTGRILTGADLDGSVVLVNFWATWCKPCRAEMPMLSRVHEDLEAEGFKVLGVAMDDVQQARDFLDELEITYTNAVGTVDVLAMSTAYGNRAGVLPYSVLIDREGIIQWAELGELEEEELVSRIKPLL